MITKYMCTVETKNYPVTTIAPMIQRYSSCKKKYNASEIANCLAAYATVTLHKKSGANVRLTRDNFKSILLAYKNELEGYELRAKFNQQIEENKEAIEEMKKETVTIKEPTTEEKVDQETVLSESLEEFQEDPENPEIEDYSYIDSEK
jgi:hypothetical protein